MVAVIMGSDSDYSVMKEAVEALKQFGIPVQSKVISAHRTPEMVSEFAKEARAKGIQVIIAGAGGAAHLPGMVAAHTELPVIGVPVPIGPLQGEDALLSIVQMPKGVPVATVAIGNAWNAGVLAVQILAASQKDPVLFQKISDYKKSLAEKVKNTQLPE